MCFALMTAVISGHSHIGMGSNLGAGLFITTVITGVVAFISDCKVNPLSFYRDIITYIVDHLSGHCLLRQEDQALGDHRLPRDLRHLRGCTRCRLIST